MTWFFDEFIWRSDDDVVAVWNFLQFNIGTYTRTGSITNAKRAEKVTRNANEPFDTQKKPSGPAQFDWAWFAFSLSYTPSSDCLTWKWVTELHAVSHI